MGSWRLLVINVVVASSLACSAPKPATSPRVPGQGAVVIEGPLTVERGRPNNGATFSKEANGDGFGPFPTAEADYQFPAAIDPVVLPEIETEIWANVVWPVPLVGPRPLVVIMHGNYYTCGHGVNPRIDDNDDYAKTGICPAGYRQTPSYLGFQYLAKRLASHGYIVVSINANRGIPIDGPLEGHDPNRVFARARLVLRHIEKLARWNAGDEPTPPVLGIDLRGKIDFGHVGLVGHSRGAEAVRLAHNEYQRDVAWKDRIGVPISFKGVFEIAGTDSGDELANGVAWVALMPVCDGDVPPGSQMKAYERMRAAGVDDELKATLAVWGANHRYFNSQWQTSEIEKCPVVYGAHQIFNPELTGSPEQQLIAGVSVVAFMLANVSADPDLGFNDMFDPSKPLPASIRDITRIDRNEFPMVDGQQIASLNEALFWPKSEPFGSVALRLREFPRLSLAKISYVRVRVLGLVGNFFLAVVRQDGTTSSYLSAKEFRAGRVVRDRGFRYEAIDFPAARLNPDGDLSKVTEIKVVFDSNVAGQVHFNDVTIGHDPQL